MNRDAVCSCFAPISGIYQNHGEVFEHLTKSRYLESKETAFLMAEKRVSIGSLSICVPYELRGERN